MMNYIKKYPFFLLLIGLLCYCFAAPFIYYKTAKIGYVKRYQTNDTIFGPIEGNLQIGQTVSAVCQYIPIVFGENWVIRDSSFITQNKNPSMTVTKGILVAIK